MEAPRDGGRGDGRRLRGALLADDLAGARGLLTRLLPSASSPAVHERRSLVAGALDPAARRVIWVPPGSPPVAGTPRCCTPVPSASPGYPRGPSRRPSGTGRRLSRRLHTRPTRPARTWA